MDRLQLVSHFAAEIIKVQLANGIKHPSPPLIKEAVEIAKAIVAALDDVHADDIEQRVSEKLGRRLDELEMELKKRASSAVASVEARLDAMIPPKTPAAPAVEPVVPPVPPVTP